MAGLKKMDINLYLIFLGVGGDWIHKYMCDRWILNTISSLKYMFNIAHTD